MGTIYEVSYDEILISLFHRQLSMIVSLRNLRSYFDAQCGHSVQIGPIMQVSRLENEMARAIFELD